jgi:ribose transport system permease protein
MLIIVRAIADLLVLKFSTQLLGSEEPSFLWDLLGTGTIAGMPTSFAILLLLAVVAHLVISRGRIGWHLLAIGGSRRSAYNAGIPVRRTVCLTYVAAGALVGLAGALYAARLGGAGGGTGLSYEISALTAVVAGGISLGGGRGSVPKAMMGAIIVFLITNTLLRLGASSGASPMLLGAVLLLAVAVDVKWNKNRSKILAKVYVSPAYLPMPPMPETSRGSQSAYAVNDRLAQVDKFGLDRLEGPEDPVLDRAGNLYCGTRQGDIMRLLAPDYEHIEVFAHIGSHPLGLAIDRDDSIVACVPGMGLYKVTKDREVIRLTDETNRTRWSVLDDSRLRLADDLDIAPDGRIFFSEATTRFGIERWIYDVQESRGNGRIICYDPSTKTTRTVLRNLVFPNGICMAGDGESLLFAETWASRVSRYWFDGPNKGQVAAVVPDLPGLPDNINRASDGNFWVALTGMRTPSMDLALSMPGFRRRMARRIAPDELLFPNLNIGCIAKINLAGEVLDVLWDASGVDHPAVTSVREDRGYLYIGGLYNNRIGRIPLRDADPEFNGPVSYWGERERQSVTA